MKIGLVCPYSIAKGGGVQEHIFATQAELQKRGHEVYILTPKPRDYEAEPARHIIFIGNARYFNSPLHTTVQVSASVNNTIDEVLARHQFDILHLHEPWVPMLSAQILSRSKCINIGTFHAKLPETIMTRTMIRVINPYTKSVLKYIDEFTAVSEAAAEYVCTLTDKPVALIPNGINLKKYTPPKKRDETKQRKTVFYVGRLEQRKGVKHLLQAFKLLSMRHPDVSLVIAGDGPEREKLQTLANELELKNVSFLGFISEKQKLHYLRTVDLACFPALYGESFGIVLLEAMATGTVAVAGDNPGYESVLKGVGALSLVNPKHYEEFARRLELLLYEKDLRSLWRTWASSQVERYTYASVVDQYEEVYRKALVAHVDKLAYKSAA